MLPHQSPLYKAFDAITAGDFKSAETHIDDFFAALESDAIALDYRRQTFDRQVFEADFVGLFTKEEIDAWCVLSAAKMHRGNYQGARDDCYKQIELIDQHYGFATPSWERPESRVPRDQELADRYLRVASNLATIMSELDDLEMSARWSKISNATAADGIDPDEVWGRWIADGPDDLEPLGLQPFDFPNWSLDKIDVDGTSWLVNLFSELPEQASPLKFATLVKVCIPTDATYDVPAKSVRWRIWSLRQAIASRFKKHNVGILFCELQRRGERVLLYYAKDEKEARQIVEPIVAAAADLSPRLEMRQDDHWQEYPKWGGRSIVSAPQTVQIQTIGQQEDENDAFLQEIWSLCEALSSVWSKLYSLLWVVDLVAPKSAAMQKYCVDYLFDLVNSLTAQEKDSALWHMAWKLPSFAPEAAVRALDMIQLDTIPNQNQCTANIAAESLADSAPDRALKIVEVLRNEGYSLIHRAAGKIAVSIARTDVQRGRMIVAETRKHILGIDEPVFAKVTYLTELADSICEIYPDEASQLLVEAHTDIRQIDRRSTRAQVYMALLEATKKASPNLLPDFCPGAIDASFDLMTPSDHWMDFCGPNLSISYLCWIVPYVVLYNNPMALELLTQATDLVAELEDEDVLDLLPSLAEASCTLDVETNQELANRLWTILELRSQAAGTPGRSFIDNRQMVGKVTPAEAFVKMNQVVAAQRAASIFSICDAAPLPEQRADLLSTFAGSMPSQPELAARLITTAVVACRSCSSVYLRAKAFAQVAASMHSLGLNSTSICADTITTIDSIEVPKTRFEAILDASKECCDKYPEFASQLLEKAIAIVHEVQSSEFIERLYGLPRSQSSKIFFELLKYRKNDQKLSEYVSRFARSFAADKAHADKWY